MNCDFTIHGGRPLAKRSNETLWLQIPLTENGTAPAITIFLAPDIAEAFAEDLLAKARKTKRAQEIEREGVTTHEQA